MLGIVDYNAGNQTSVRRALEHIGISCVITAEPARLSACEGIIFPGVGSASQAMAELSRSGMDMALREAVAKGQPVLGICLGCQILLEMSEEGPVETLGIVRGKCPRFAENILQEDGTPAKIPHMGWNGLKRIRQSEILKNIPENAEFYFVHSYYVEPEPSLVLATATHGLEFCAVYGRPGLWAAQFHPEKSGRAGLALLANFNACCQEGGHVV